MRVLHLSKSDFRGATSRGVLTLHRQLIQRGIQSRFFAKERFLEETEQILECDPVMLSKLTQETYFDGNLKHELASSFTLGFPGNGQLDIQTLRDADIIHLHDIKGLFSPRAVNRLLSLGKPVVWSISDMWAFTGGCHYALECSLFKNDCNHCPQIRDAGPGLPAVLLEKKRALLSAPNLHIVASSRWLAERAAESRVFAGASIHTIPTILSDAVCPKPKLEAKAQLGIAPDVFTMLVVCENTGNQQRYREMVKQLLDHCDLYKVLTRLAKKNQLRILILGAGSEELRADYGVEQLGDVHDPKKLSLLFSAADIAVLPHFEENGNQIVLEAADCGTPVIAMNACGMDESIRDGVTGWLVRVGDLRRMAEEISYVALHRRIQHEWESNCLAAFTEAPKNGVEQHIELYRRILETGSVPAKGFPSGAHLEVPNESADLHPVFLDNLASILRTPRAREEAALAAVDELKRAIAITMEKLSLAEERIQKQLRAGTPDPIIESSIVSVGKVTKYLARVLCEQELSGNFQDQYFRSRVPAPATSEAQKTSQELPVWDGISKLASRFGIGKKHITRPGTMGLYAPRPMVLETFPKPHIPAQKLPTIAVVTPSYMQGGFIEQTILSVIDQGYPNLRYAVQDAGSTDETVDILKKHSSRITSWVSEPDTGQTRAIACGFEKVTGDIMAWLNSDDLFMPGALQFVGEYFQKHPDVDVIYGHRVTIDENGQEIGRWVLPPHDPEVLLSHDYVPQETLFWRESLWKKVGGISSNFRFAMDWDLLLRFQESGAKIVRVPYYLGCFRVHSLQKSNAQVESIGNKEVNFLRSSTQGAHTDPAALAVLTKRVTRQSALCAWLLRHGIRW